MIYFDEETFATFEPYKLTIMKLWLLLQTLGLLALEFTAHGLKLRVDIKQLKGNNEMLILL